MSDSVNVGTGGGVTVDEKTQVVVVGEVGQSVIAADKTRVVIVASEKAVLVKSAALTSNSDFQNLFIGFPNSFPLVTVPSLLLKSGQFADPTVYEPHIFDED